MQILPNDEKHREDFDNGVDFASGIPMFTSVRLLQNHMKPPKLLVNLTGTFCLALFWPE